MIDVPRTLKPPVLKGVVPQGCKDFRMAKFGLHSICLFTNYVLGRLLCKLLSLFVRREGTT